VRGWRGAVLFYNLRTDRSNLELISDSRAVFPTVQYDHIGHFEGVVGDPAKSFSNTANIVTRFVSRPRLETVLPYFAL
jgi:hypothetical protein